MMKEKKKEKRIWFMVYFDPIVWISSKTTLEIILRISFSTNNIYFHIFHHILNFSFRKKKSD